MADMSKGTYCTTYCNHGHDLATGKPIDHECYVIPPLALLAERDGDFATAVEIMDRARRNGEMVQHTGMGGNANGQA
jgi:hypothetical protein